MPARLDGSIILNPGLLRHQITWQQKSVTTRDSYGQDTYTWADVLTCRAGVRSLGGNESEKVLQKWADAEFEITQHFSAGLTADMRIAWLIDGSVKYLDVLNVNDPAGTGRYQTVICRTFEGTFTA